MLDSLFSTIAPHLCYNCGEVGAVLCENCKYDIIEETVGRCIICKLPTERGYCSRCQASFARSWFVGEREGMLKKLTNDYKFENVKAAHKDLAWLLSAHIGQLPSEIIVTSIPTVASHIRQRGYDHAALLAKTFATLQNLPYQPVLLRTVHTATQRKASKKARVQQASTAFKTGKVSNAAYLLIDDIYTTGATLEYASRVLLAAGAKEVWVATLCVQLLDERTDI